MQQASVKSKTESEYVKNQKILVMILIPNKNELPLKSSSFFI